MNAIKEEATVQSETVSPTTSTPELAHSSRERVLAIIVAVGMLAVGFIGGWILASAGDDSAGSDDAATWGAEIDEAILSEIDELLDDYWAGWDAGDGDAVVAVMAANGKFSSPYTAGGGHTGDQLADYVDKYSYMQFTRVGPTTVIETRAGYEVAGAELADGGYYLDHFVIVEEEGRLRIASHAVISAV